jgi:hypothetical protein
MFCLLGAFDKSLDVSHVPGRPLVVWIKEIKEKTGRIDEGYIYQVRRSALFQTTVDINESNSRNFWLIIGINGTVQKKDRVGMPTHPNKEPRKTNIANTEDSFVYVSLAAQTPLFAFIIIIEEFRSFSSCENCFSTLKSMFGWFCDSRKNYGPSWWTTSFF